MTGRQQFKYHDSRLWRCFCAYISKNNVYAYSINSAGFRIAVGFLFAQGNYKTRDMGNKRKHSH